jgi:adenylate cyclase
VFKVTGDGIFVEFGSAANAVQCAIDLQREMATANADLPTVRHIVQGSMVMASTFLSVLSVSRNGDVLVSGTAFDHVRNKVDTVFEELGTQPLRNIAEPVRAYRVATTPRVPVYSFVFVSARLPPRRPEIARIDRCDGSRLVASGSKCCITATTKQNKRMVLTGKFRFSTTHRV